MQGVDNKREKENELDLEASTNEAMKLLKMELDALYVTLGSQLLARNLPSRTAEIVSDLCAFRSLSEQKSRYAAQPSQSLLPVWRKRLGRIYDELRQDGKSYVAKMGEDLRKALSNEDILSLSEHVNRSTLQIIVVIVGGTLRMPVELEPISVTVSAILLKVGLRNFCTDSTPY